MPPPTVVHGTLCNNIAVEVTLYARKRRKGFVATNDSSVLLERDPDTVRGPDVAYFESVANFRELQPKHSEIPPVLAVEVLSPSDSFRKVSNKIKLFLSAGVKLVWLVDPEEQTISVYRPDGSWKVIAADQQLIGDPELPGFTYRVSDFFLLPSELPPELETPPAR